MLCWMRWPTAVPIHDLVDAGGGCGAPRRPRRAVVERLALPIVDRPVAGEATYILPYQGQSLRMP